MTEFDLINGHRLVIERSGKRYPIILLDPARAPIPVYTLNKDFWFGWTLKKKFMEELAKGVGCDPEALVDPLKKIASEIALRGKKILEPQRPSKKTETGKEEDNGTVVLSGEFAERLEKEAFSLAKPLWGCDTKFFVFVKKVTFQESDKVIEVGDAVELPADMADELWKGGLACEHPWQCRKCKAAFLECPENDKCPNCFAAPSEFESSPMIELRPEGFSAIGDALLKNYRFATPIETISESKLGLTHMYNRGYYTMDGAKGYIKKKVKEIVSDSDPGLERAVLNHIAVKTAIPENWFGVKEERTVVENGMLNLNDKKLVPHDPNAYALAYIPTKYNPNAARPKKFLEYLRFAFPSEADIRRIQELFGTALVAKKYHKKGSMLVGPTDVGKSTFIDVVRGFFGEENVSEESLESLANTRWAPASLRGKLVNTSDETRAGSLRDPTIIKKIMAGNPVMAEFKFEKRFKFWPTCEHFHACNQTPTAERRDDAFWNRWFTIEMPRQIPYDKQEPDFHKKLLEEREGILIWAIKGFERFKKNGYRFSDPQDWKEARDRWLSWGDSIQRFIQTCIVRSKDRELKIEASKCYDVYTAFAEESDLDVQDQKTLTAEIKKLPYAEYSNAFRFDGRKQRGFKGIDIDLTTLTTLKPKFLYIFHPTIQFSKYSIYANFISSQIMEDQRSQRSQGQERLPELLESQKKPKKPLEVGITKTPLFCQTVPDSTLPEVEELGETPRKIAQDEAKTTPSIAVHEQTSILTAESTISDIEHSFFDIFGINWFKEAQLKRLCKDDTTLKKVLKVLEDMRERNEVILIVLESGERSWRLVVERDIDDAMAQQDKIRRVMTIIGDLEDQYGGAAPVEEIKRVAELEGIGPKFVEELIEQEKGRGHLYEPKQDMIARAVK